MLNTNKTILFFLFLPFFLSAQNYAVNQINPLLMVDAYAIVREDHTQITLKSIDKMIAHNHKAITVLNEAGEDFIKESIKTSPSTKLQNFSAKLYNAKGELIKEYKTKDRIKQSATPPGFLFTDDQLHYHNIVSNQYPYTVEYTIEIETKNTVFLPSWSVYPYYFVGVEKSSYEFINETEIPLRIKKNIPKQYPVQENQIANKKQFSIQNQLRVQPEPLSPSLHKVTPTVYFSLEQFSLEGVKGKAKDWREFGYWMYNNLISGNQELSQEDEDFVKQTISEIPDPTEQIKAIYQYMQNKTRYVFVGLGIGGWQPFNAKYVGEKSYGDCKALSNYMLSMLKSAGIESLYTVINSNDEFITSFDKDFTRMQGNHVILGVPIEEDTLWLECTSQKIPYNFLGKSTQGRYALAVNDKGGKIVKTQTFSDDDNQEIVTAKGVLQSNGSLSISVTNHFTGLQYEDKLAYDGVDDKSINELLNKHFNEPKQPSFKQTQFQNNKDSVIYTINTTITSEKYARQIGNNLLFNLIPIRRWNNGLKKDPNRVFPFQINVGYLDESTFVIKLPTGATLDSAPEPVRINTDFGYYELNYHLSNNHELIVKRKVKIKQGEYPPKQFNHYVAFREQIKQSENKSILLTLNN